MYVPSNSVSADGCVRLCRDMRLNNIESFFQQVLIEPLLSDSLGELVILMGPQPIKLTYGENKADPEELKRGQF